MELRVEEIELYSKCMKYPHRAGMGRGTDLIKLGNSSIWKRKTEDCT